MKKIKFRGKRLDDGKWIKGSGIKVSESGTVVIYDEISLRWYEVDPETVGMLTDTWDKNLKDIWEGDLLKLPYDGTYILGMVVFDTGAFFFQEIPPFRDRCEAHIVDLNTLFFENGDEIEVVGNIYDNQKPKK